MLLAIFPWDLAVLFTEFIRIRCFFYVVRYSENTRFLVGIITFNEFELRVYYTISLSLSENMYTNNTDTHRDGEGI